MYKLYNVKAWGSLGPHCVLEEMQVPYTNIWMTPEQVRAPEFRDINPLALIPALGLQDGRTVIESAAIVTFLVTAHPDKQMAPFPGSDDFGEFLSWLNFMSTNLYPAINFTYPGNSYAMSPEHDAFIVRKGIEKSNELWAVIEKRLAKEGPWMLGKTYSALDIYAFMLTLWCKPDQAAVLKQFPHVAKLVQGVRERPKLKAALEAHGVL